MDTQFSDYDSFSDGVYSNPGLHTGLQKIPNSTLKYLNYTTSYVRNWGIDEAFRETYQNWRDGILKSYNIKLSQFRTEIAEVKQVILIKAINMSTDVLVGFIRFQYDEDGNSVRGLKVVNFNATLPFSSLGTGATSKATDSGQTGQHGEGMKLSALVFRRNNYNFRIESGEFKWNFIFKKGELACGLKRMGAKTLGDLKQKEEGQSRTDIARPWLDVCVVIGAPGNTSTVDGQKTRGKPVHLSDFRKMLKVTLDIDPPKNMIRTPQGNLIRDPTYQGMMYLRGLLLPSGGMSGKQYTYGYDFVDGSTTRDRDTLAGSGEESKRIADIWAAVIRGDNSEDLEMTTEYTNLLLKHLNKRGDAILGNGCIRLAKDIACRVWIKMRSMNHNQQGRTAFYYSAIEGKDEVHIIEQSLDQNPIPLDLELWKILRKYNLCRTPSEELLHRFKSATKAKIPNQSFAMHVSKMLRCLLLSFIATKAMKIEFVNGEQLRIDAGFFENTWQVHNKWLTWEGAHETAFCDDDPSDNQELFTCDHVVLQLWDIMLSQLIATGNHPQVASHEAWLKGMARSRLSQMPRSVSCFETDKIGELCVNWETVDSYRHREKPVRVVLHADGCSNTTGMQYEPWTVLQHLSDQEPKCTCSSMLSRATSSSFTFTDLDPTKSYFPSISQDVAGAFVALQPLSVKPRAENLSKTTAIQDEFVSESVTMNAYSPVGSGQNPIVLNDDESVSIIDSDIDMHDDHDDRTSYEDFYEHPTPYKSRRTASSSFEAGGSVDMTRDTSSHLSAPPPIQTRKKDVSTITPTPRNITRDEGAQTDLISVRTEELYVVGEQIEHRSLDWGGSFPGSHAFYRTRDAPGEDVFILKPKQQSLSQVDKRHAEEDLPAHTPKRRQARASARDTNTSLERASTIPYRHHAESGTPHASVEHHT